MYNEPINLNRTFKFLIPKLKNMLEFKIKEFKKIKFKGAN